MKNLILASSLLVVSFTANSETLNLTPYNTAEYTADSIAKGTNLIAYTEHQINYLNQVGVTNNQVGFALAKEW